MHCTAMIACPRRQRAGWCTSGDWGHNCDWRAAVLERAATRPCTHPAGRSQWQGEGMIHGLDMRTATASCQSTPPVAR